MPVWTKQRVDKMLAARCIYSECRLNLIQGKYNSHTITLFRVRQNTIRFAEIAVHSTLQMISIMFIKVLNRIIHHYHSLHNIIVRLSSNLISTPAETRLNCSKQSEPIGDQFVIPNPSLLLPIANKTREHMSGLVR